MEGGEALGVVERVASMKDDMVEALRKFVSINSVNPAGGGPGEKEKADYLQELLENMGFPYIKRYDPVDSNGVVRSNIVAKIPGESDRTLWFVTHIDTVPEGDRKLWKHDPFDPVIEGDKIYGRGSEDNGGSMIASIFAGKALLDEGIKPKYTFGLALVADEEYGSKWGIEYLINQGVFSEEDLFVIPDAGNSEGDFIEVAEKGILWLQIEVLGKQGHASLPHLSKNAFRKGAELLLKIDEGLKTRFDKVDIIFEPSESTFEPTKAEKTVDNVNTIPGRFVFCIDSRVLPEYELDDVVKAVEEIVEEEKGKFEVKVSVLQRLDAAPPTPADSEIVKLLKSTVEKVRGIEVRIGGIGGGTCAAFFRKKGWHAAVWSTIDETAHQPNEYKRISHLVEDAKVFAAIFE